MFLDELEVVKFWIKNVTKLTKFFSHGKLLITGEYVVLDQALSLAIPTKKGQHMLIKEFAEEPRTLFWKSLGDDGNAWFEQKFLIQKKTKSNNNW